MYIPIYIEVCKLNKKARQQKYQLNLSFKSRELIKKKPVVGAGEGVEGIILVSRERRRMIECGGWVNRE